MATPTTPQGIITDTATKAEKAAAKLRAMEFISFQPKSRLKACFAGMHPLPRVSPLVSTQGKTVAYLITLLTTVKKDTFAFGAYRVITTHIDQAGKFYMEKLASDSAKDKKDGLIARHCGALSKADQKAMRAYWAELKDQEKARKGEANDADLFASMGCGE